MMDWVSVGICFVEIFSIFLIYNLIFDKKMYCNLFIYISISIVTAIMFIYLRSFYNIDSLIALLGSIFINAIILNRVEKKDVIIIITELISAMLLVLTVELIALLFISLIINDNEMNNNIYLLIISGVMYIFIFILYKKISKINFRFTEKISKYKFINIIILNIFIFMLFIKVLIVNDLMNIKITIPITILTIVLIGINIYFYLYLYKTIAEKKKKEMKKSFNPLINDLMHKVKSTEHEYKNHLNAIYGIAQVTSGDELKEKIKGYIGEIVVENEEASKLLHIDNTIVKAVLYNKIQRADKLGIICNYRVTSDLKNIPIDDSELTVILSNLINNAIEATSPSDKKEVNIIIEELENQYIITVQNYIENLSGEIISNMFKRSFSTKSEGRGYGLYNIKKIIDKNKGKINVVYENNIITLVVIFNRA